MRIGSLGLALMVVVALAGCGAPGGKVSTLTPAPPQQTEPAPVEVTAEPTPTPTAPPTVNPTPEATTAQANDAPTPDAVLTQKDYYVVEQNQRTGVVDRTGRVVLPFAFSEISKLNPFYDYGTSLTDEEPVATFFLAVPYEVRTDGAKKPRNDVPARLYNTQGQAINEEGYSDGYWLDKDVLTLDRSGSAQGWGALDPAGHTVVPFQYDQIVRFARYLVGCDNDNKKMDFYDRTGKLLKTLSGSARYVSQTYLIASDDKGRVGLLDEELRWLFLDEYQRVEPLAADRFLVYDGIIGRVVDAQGKGVLPKPYQSIEATLDKDGKITGYVCASDAVPTVAAYDAQGKLIFEKDGYFKLRAIGPYYYAGTETHSHALDAKGQRILTNITDNVENWWEDAGLFECYNPDRSSISFVHPDGTVVPLPVGNYALCLGANRFLVSADDTHFGVSDAQGHWVVPPDYVGLYQMNGVDKTLLATQSNGLSGIMDYDGKWLLPPVFDSVYGPLDGLLQARKGDRSGVLDWTGHWVWSTSDYDYLDD